MQGEYFQPKILPSPHFVSRSVVNQNDRIISILKSFGIMRLCKALYLVKYQLKDTSTARMGVLNGHIL